MAKYCFKLYLNDGSYKMVIPSSLDENQTELSDLDKFVYNCGGSFKLHELLADELNIEFSQIDTISIFQVKTGKEYSVIINNPYLSQAITSVNKKIVKGYQNYDMETMVVSNNSSSYLEMEKYLFNHIESDYQYFLTEIYKYNNQFTRLLYQYGDAYHQKSYNEEELRNLQEQKDKIKQGLSIYKNFRSLCKSRYENEKRYGTPISKKTPLKEEIVKYSIPEYHEENFPHASLEELNQYTNKIGEEKEEFLDMDEIESEYDYGKRR